MRKLLPVLTVIALLHLGGNAALADDPRLSLQPDARPSTDQPAAGGTATAGGGTLGPASFTPSEPLVVSSGTAPQPNGPSNSSTTASAPGTSASSPARTRSTTSPSAPDGSAPEPQASQPTADADTNRSRVWTSDSGVHAILISRATGAAGASAGDTASAQDPTNASTCSTADASPGVPTDVRLGTACGGAPSTVSEDSSASGAGGGGGAAGTPSAASCSTASASAGAEPSAGLGSSCGSSGTSTPSTGGTGPNGNGAGGYGSADAAATPTGSNGLGTVAFQSGSTGFAALLGLEGLPSTSTAESSIAGLGLGIGIAGALLLLRRRRSGDLP